MKTTCETCQNYMADALWNDLSEADQVKFQLHLDKCDECNEIWAEMQAVTTFVEANPPAEPENSFWDSYWENLEDKLDPPAIKQPVWKPWIDKLNELFVLPEWQMPRRLALASLLIIGGILIGRNWPANQVTPVQETQIADASVADQQTLQYLERSRILLSSMVNFETGTDDIDVLDIPYKQKVSDELLIEAEVLMASLDRREQRQVRRLITDLTRILQQISNLESDRDVFGLELVQDGVDHQGLMLKINIEALRAIQATPVPKPRNDA